MLKKAYLFVVNHMVAIVIFMALALVAAVFIDGLMEVMLALTTLLLVLVYYGIAKAMAATWAGDNWGGGTFPC